MWWIATTWWQALHARFLEHWCGHQSNCHVLANQSALSPDALASCPQAWSCPSPPLGTRICWLIPNCWPAASWMLPAPLNMQTYNRYSNSNLRALYCSTKTSALCKCVRVCVQRYGDNPTIMAWDLIKWAKMIQVAPWLPSQGLQCILTERYCKLTAQILDKTFSTCIVGISCVQKQHAFVTSICARTTHPYSGVEYSSGQAVLHFITQNEYKQTCICPAAWLQQCTVWSEKSMLYNRWLCISGQNDCRWFEAMCGPYDEKKHVI